MKNDSIESTENHMKPLDYTSKIDDTLKDSNMNFNNNDNRFLSLACVRQDCTAIFRKFNISGISIISLGKDTFTEFVFTSMLAYLKQAMSWDEFCRIFWYLLVANSVDVVVDDVVVMIFQN